jgi:Lrp/AsnC family transcriptional regulator, leucine-responsive regulatory protein
MLDEKDHKIVMQLAVDSRVSLKALASRVDLSPPSVADRIRRLEDRGIIRMFTIAIDPVALGYHLEAIVRVRPLPGRLAEVQRLIEDCSEFTECDKVTGDDCFVARLHLRSVAELDGILDRITDKAETSTSIVKSSPIRRRLPPL